MHVPKRHAGDSAMNVNRVIFSNREQVPGVPTATEERSAYTLVRSPRKARAIFFLVGFHTSEAISPIRQIARYSEHGSSSTDLAGG